MVSDCSAVVASLIPSSTLTGTRKKQVDFEEILTVPSEVGTVVSQSISRHEMYLTPRV